MKINLIILTINTYIIYKSGQLIYSANKVISLYKQDSPIVYFVPNIGYSTICNNSIC